MEAFLFHGVSFCLAGETVDGRKAPSPKGKEELERLLAKDRAVIERAVSDEKAR